MCGKTFLCEHVPLQSAPDWAPPSGWYLEHWVTLVSPESLNTTQIGLCIADQVCHSGPVLGRDTLEHILALLSTALTSAAQESLSGEESSSDTHPREILQMLTAYAPSRSAEILASDIRRPTFVAVHRLAFTKSVAGSSKDNTSVVDRDALKLWKAIATTASSAELEAIRSLIYEDQIECALDTGLRVQ